MIYLVSQSNRLGDELNALIYRGLKEKQMSATCRLDNTSDAEFRQSYINPEVVIISDIYVQSSNYENQLIIPFRSSEKELSIANKFKEFYEDIVIYEEHRELFHHKALNFQLRFCVKDPEEIKVIANNILKWLQL